MGWATCVAYREPGTHNLNLIIKPLYVSVCISLIHITVLATVQGTKTGQESKNMCSILGMQYNASELETKLEHDGRARANKQQQRQQDA